MMRNAPFNLFRMSSMDVALQPATSKISEFSLEKDFLTLLTFPDISIRPLLSKTTSLHNSSTDFMLWVESTIVAHVNFWYSSKVSIKKRKFTGSTPEKGSSINITEGLLTRQLANCTFCCIPFDSSDTRRCFQFSISSFLSQ